MSALIQISAKLVPHAVLAGPVASLAGWKNLTIRQLLLIIDPSHGRSVKGLALFSCFRSRLVVIPAGY